MIFHPVMGIQIVMKVMNQTELLVNVKFGRHSQGAGQTSSAGQPQSQKDP